MKSANLGQFFFFLTLAKIASSDSLQKFEKLQAYGKPYLETYWESYDSFPFTVSNCHHLNLEPDNPIDESAYGFDLRQVPDHVQVVNIAFAILDFVSL